MPIIVRHEPDPQFLAQIGYQIGQGQAVQEQEERAFREQQAAPRGCTPTSSRSASRKTRWRRRQQIGIEADTERQQAGFGFRKQLQQDQWQNQSKLQQSERDWQRSEDLFKHRLARENILLGEEVGERRDIGKSYIDETAKAIQSLYGKRFSPAQQAKIDQFLQKQAETESGIATGQFPRIPSLEALAKEAQALALSMGEPEPTPEEEVSRRVIHLNPDPDTGRPAMDLMVQPDGKLVPYKDNKTAEARQDEILAQGWMKLAEASLKTGEPGQVIGIAELKKRAAELRASATEALQEEGPTAPPAEIHSRPKKPSKYTLDLEPSLVNPGPWSASYGAP